MTAETAPAPVTGLLSRLDAVRQRGASWVARCPAHEDKVPSLTIDAGKDGRALLYCHAGCSAADIADALGIPLSDLFADELPKAEPTSVYAYRDEAGTLLYNVVRMPGKQFRQRRADGEWTMTGVRRVLYRLPELIAADPAETVYIVEGEKDADRLASLGLIATTSVGGAGKWRPEYAEPLHGRRVVILPDNDDPGRDHAADVARSTGGTIVNLPGLPPKGDVSDWLDAGGTVDELRRLTTANSRYVTLASVTPRAVEWLWQGYIPLGKVTIIDGDPGLGKSTLVLDVAARGSRGLPSPTGTPLPTFDTLLVTGEDDPADTIRPRLDVAGGDPARVHILTDLTLPDEADRLAEVIDRTGATLVVIDPLAAHTAERVKTSVDNSVRRMLQPLAKLAESRHISIVAIRHLNKQAGGDAIYRGGGSIGFTGLARSVLAVGRDPDDEERFVLASVKNNVGRRPPSLAYRLVAAGPYDPARVEWEGETHHTAEALIGRDREQAAGQGKAAMLAETIRAMVEANGGEIAARDGYRALEAEGIDTDADKALIYRAREKAGVVTVKSAMDGGWVWRVARP